MNHGNAIMDVPCDAIRIGERHRKDMGDLDALAASIAQEGLLQPIGVTDDNVLVFGERRLLAVRDLLKRPTIPARVVHVSSILAGEFAENEIRKDFTPSERAAIGKALEDTLGERRGRNNRQNSDELKGHRSDDLAAERAGFGSRASYEDAKKVVEHGTPELVEAMDNGELSINAASVIASEPPERQAEILKQPAEVRREIVRELREAAKLPTPSEARRIARETGMLVADNTGRYRSGASEKEREAAKADLDAIWAVTRAVLALADTQLDPVELAARLEYWHCPGIRAKTPTALQWLTQFQEGIERNAEVS